jgi:hypothetical protein
VWEDNRCSAAASGGALHAPEGQYPSEIGGPESPDETSTVIRFRDGKVVSMRAYRTEAEARAAAE